MVKHMQYVVFNIASELYGIGIDAVREIVRVPDITEVPEAPGFLEGVINLRGRIVPVIDLRKRLRLEGTEISKSSRVLVTDSSGGLLGLLVDSVSEVLRIQPDSVEEPPEMVSAVGVEYISGVAKLEGRLIILLDLTRILSVEDMKKVAASTGGSMEEAA